MLILTVVDWFNLNSICIPLLLSYYEQKKYTTNINAGPREEVKQNVQITPAERSEAKNFWGFSKFYINFPVKITFHDF